jgi:very-short-patch-repair endonuclease
MPSKLRKSEPKNSPPYKGGVPEGRSGSPVRKQVNNLLKLKPFRTELRNNLTPAEATLWKVLKNNNHLNRKFRRQHSVGNYVLDFYCPAEKLAVELDGEVHFNNAAREHDGVRRAFLSSCGIRVLRFENKSVFKDLEWVLGIIEINFGWSERTTPHPSDASPPL